MPNEVFKMTGLTYLNLDHNNIEELPLSIGKLGYLKTLSFADNAIQVCVWVGGWVGVCVCMSE